MKTPRGLMDPLTNTESLAFYLFLVPGIFIGLRILAHMSYTVGGWCLSLLVGLLVPFALILLGRIVKQLTQK